jgi:hypothetical protein
MEARSMRSLTDLTDTAGWLADHDDLPVVAWDDGHPGFDPRSPYVETYWLAILGPSSVLAARRLASWLEGGHAGIVVRLEDLAHCLGLGHGTGRHSAIVRTLDRLVIFGLARILGDAYAVRTVVPPLAPAQLRRLPSYLIERHRHDFAVLPADAPGSRSPRSGDRIPS